MPQGVTHAQAWPPHEGGQSSRARYFRGRPLYAVNGTNATIPLPPSTATQIDLSTGASGAPTLTSLPECQDDDYTSTTTIEVTVFITESQEEQSSTESAVISATIEAPYPVNATTTRAPGYGQETYRGTGAVYPGITATSSTRQYYPGGPVYGNSTSTSISSSTLSGSPDISNTTSSTSATFLNTTTATITTKDVYRETAAPISNLTATYAPKSTDDCVIDTAIAPVATATLTAILTESIAPTATVTDGDIATGKPQPQTRHCGVHGLPVGTYFIARFVENAPGVPVTLEGCYQFCTVSDRQCPNLSAVLTLSQSVMEATEGCRSYRFYPERGLNVPQCDLYGSPVAYALDRIEESHVDIWFDIECGSPRSDRWAALPGLERLAELGLE